MSIAEQPDYTAIEQRMSEIMEPESIAPWLKQPNEWFDGHTPLQALEEGKADKIWELISHTKECGYL